MSKFYEMLNGASDALLMESLEDVNVAAVKIEAIDEFVEESVDVEILTEGIVDKIKSAATYVWNKIKDFFKACRRYLKSAWDWVVKKYNAAKEYLKKKFSKEKEEAKAAAAETPSGKVKAAETPVEKAKGVRGVKTVTLPQMVKLDSLDKVANFVDGNVAKVNKVSDAFITANNSEEAKKRYQAAIKDLSDLSTSASNRDANFTKYLQYADFSFDIDNPNDVKKRIDDAEKRINNLEKSVLKTQSRYNDVVKMVEAGKENGISAASIKTLVKNYVIDPSLRVCRIMLYDIDKLVKEFAKAIGTPKQEVVNGIKVKVSMPI